MKIVRYLNLASRFSYKLLLQSRLCLPPKQCFSFASRPDLQRKGIDLIYVINLDRQPDRWSNVVRELTCVLDCDRKPLADKAVRYSASDAQSVLLGALDPNDIEPFYTLGEQLYVEPQPHSLPDEFDLNQPVRMSDAEIAIARSHIGVWREIARSEAPYALVIEDDVWFRREFSEVVDQAWLEMKNADNSDPAFDIMYLSYAEARHGAEKELLSKNVFCPRRGLWFLSGYVLSRKGAQRLIQLLPCRGPIDLWINHKFDELDVRAVRRPVINQRADISSTNSYSIIPALTKIGILDYGDTALFHQRPTCSPVFVFGAACSGLSSLAMALSMLGYRCCSDFNEIPERELERLISGRLNRVFDAYVNIASLWSHLSVLRLRYPQAKFIVIDLAGAEDQGIEELVVTLRGADVVRLTLETTGGWRALCEFLRLPPPAAPYPIVPEIGQRTYLNSLGDTPNIRPTKRLKQDSSPWVVKKHDGWKGLSASFSKPPEQLASKIIFHDDFAEIAPTRWQLRTDTFPGNLGLFRPENLSSQVGGGLALTVRSNALGVRNFSAAAISSLESFLYGRFEAMLQATNVSGVVTGFFLHRNSPRQEIDIEIAGNRPTQLLANVFYNPGGIGARFDYGYRGTPVAIPLGFDASKAPHLFAIEWDPCEIRWFVDGELVHRRAVWDPTPIPHLPMTLHVNTWPSRSKDLAGRLAARSLPASATLGAISVDAFNMGEDAVR